MLEIDEDIGKLFLALLDCQEGVLRRESLGFIPMQFARNFPIQI